MKYEPAGFFLARTPLLPVETWRAWTTAPTAADANQCLERLVDDPATKEALFLASRSLSSRLEIWRASGSAPPPNLEGALGRYLTRMTTRSTPFATLAGVALGAVEHESCLELEPRDTNVCRFQLDLDIVEAWAHDVARRRRDLLVWRPNPTLQALGDRYRYTTRSRKGHGDWSGVEAELLNNSTIDALLARAGRKGLRLSALRGASRTVAERLVDAQVLVSDLTFLERVSDDDPTLCLLRRLRAAGLDEDAKALSTLLARIAEEEAATFPRAPRTYQEIEQTAPWYGEEQPSLRVDLVKRAPRLRLSRALCDELSVLLVELSAMTRKLPLNEQFKRTWRDRYGEREVTFREAADPETGIFRALADAPADTSDRDPKREAFVQRKLVDLATAGLCEWNLSDDDVAKLSVPNTTSSSTRVELVALLCGSPTAGEEPFVVLHRGRGIHASMLGRFTRLGPEFADAIRDYAHEEAPNTVFADIDVLPHAAMGNSMSRVALHPARVAHDDHRSPSGAPPIDPYDLRIQLDRNGFRVLSTTLGCQVALRLAHSQGFWFDGNPTGYRLLCHLARQPDRVGLSFPWGSLETTARRLPRVTRGRHVVSLARWTFDRTEIAGWFVADRSAAALAIARARAQYAIPRHLLIVDGDNLLAVDLESDRSVLACASALPAQGDVTLLEALALDAAVRGPEGRFVCEIVLPFTRVDDAESAAAFRPLLAPSPKARRSHSLGGEWSFVKLYCGPRAADRLLTELVSPLVADIRRALGDVPWFFVRHSDPDDHLRVRVRTRTAAGTALVLQKLAKRSAPFERDGSLLRTALDTYDREVERYGGFEAMAHAERIFHRDSEACLRLLCDDELDVLWDRNARWLTALLSLSRFMHLLPLSPLERVTLLGSGRTSTWKMLGLAPDFEGELSQRYRARRLSVESFLSGEDARTTLVTGVLDARDAKITIELKAIARLAHTKRTTAGLADIGRSLGHLLVTRMMRAPSRVDELALLDTLWRHERSVLGRARKNGPVGNEAPTSHALRTRARNERQ